MKLALGQTLTHNTPVSARATKTWKVVLFDKSTATLRGIRGDWHNTVVTLDRAMIDREFSEAPMDTPPARVTKVKRGFLNIITGEYTEA